MVFAAKLLAVSVAFAPCMAHETLSLKQGADNLIHNTRILYPSIPGDYPVFTFLHGFALDVETYDQILKDVAEHSIVILFQMKFRVVTEGIDEDAGLLQPYLHDADQGILPRIGDSILAGYSYSSVALGGHSRGGGVLAYAYSHGIVKDGDYSALVLIDPVVAHPDTDVPSVALLDKTKLRVIYFNDADSSCVTNGWPDAISAAFSATDVQVISAPECKHMDVCSSWGGVLPLCHSGNADECKQQARDLIADATSVSNVV